jgi:glycerol kinase
VILYLGAVDQGTTSTRFVLFDREGRVRAWAQKEHAQSYPRPGWVEHDAAELWANTREVMARALAESGIPPREVGAIGVTNQRETTVLWDRTTGEPLHPAIVWQDTRTADACAVLALRYGREDWQARTGLPPATYFSGPKLAWILAHSERAQAAVREGRALFGTVDTWLIWNLTGGAHVTDPTNASRTLLFDLKTLDWAPDLLARMAIPRELLPSIRPSSDPDGYGAVAEGPLKGIPVCGALGDQQAALFGQACFEPGEAKNTYGTGCFLLMNTGERPVPSTHGLLTTVAYQLPGRPAQYALEGSIAMAGSLVQWARDRMGLFASVDELNDLAAQAGDNGGVYLVPAFSGLFAPHWRPEAQGLITGLTHFAGRPHLARAILEATAYQTRDLFVAMAEDSGVRLRGLKVDGGMTASGLLMQFQADLLDVPVLKPVVAETTALGAAYAAGLAVGFWQGLPELQANWAEGARWQPRMEPATRDRLCEGWRRAVARSY